MCGIVGYVGTRAMDAPDWLAGAAGQLAHRGPDDHGVWYSADRSVGLAHRRLSILDLSAAGCQPMQRADGSLRVVFNGEIYNYRELRSELHGHGATFTTGTDTEVLLAAYQRWGTACLQHLVGMFAFALYDEKRRSLFLARDRAGEKPLFYRTDGDGLVFGSELKALLAQPAAPRRMDPVSLEFYLAFGYVPGPHCILDGYRKLQPGEALLYNQEDRSLRSWRYWTVPPPARTGASEEELTDELDGLLETAVRRQLVADVPVGVLLSGGLDSSLVTAMAARCSPDPIRTFTVTFPGHGAYDESPHARAVAEHYGTRHTELVAEPVSVDLLPRLARQYDEPLADSSMVPTYLVSRLIRESATVALAGDGGDELFGGYKHYSWLQWQARLRRFMPAPARGLVGRLGRALPIGFRGRNHLMAFGSEPRRSGAHINLFFDAETRARLVGSVSRPDREPDETPERFKMGLWSTDLSEAENGMRLDFATYLPDDLLVKVDRASMFTSLEVRAPFLDAPILDFAFGRVPESMKVVGRSRKILTRRLGTRLLPASMDLRRKQGFSLPLDAWFRDGWGEWMADVLSQAPADLLAPVVVAELFSGQASGRPNTQRIFALTMLELWRREYNIETADVAARPLSREVA